MSKPNFVRQVFCVPCNPPTFDHLKTQYVSFEKRWDAPCVRWVSMQHHEKCLLACASFKIASKHYYCPLFFAWPWNLWAIISQRTKSTVWCGYCCTTDCDDESDSGLMVVSHNVFLWLKRAFLWLFILSIWGSISFGRPVSTIWASHCVNSLQLTALLQGKRSSHLILRR